ncbi:MAG: hypothetical protein ACOYLH_04670 [Flavobacteriales bacterium]
MTPRFFFFALASLITLVSSCKKEARNVHILEGKVYDGRTGSGISGAFVEVQQQVLSDGTFSGVFNTAGTSNSGAGGGYTIEWERANMVEVKVLCEATNYIEREIQLDPGAFSPDQAVGQDIALYPEAFITINISRPVFGSATDQFDFRFDNADFDCLCCNNNWKSIEGADADTTFTCRLYGDTWLRFKKQIITADLDTLITDSIYCPRLLTTTVNIEW